MLLALADAMLPSSFTTSGVARASLSHQKWPFAAMKAIARQEYDTC
jgi:hypothetical protein